MADLLVYTAVFGDTHPLAPAAPYPGVEYVCITDKPREAEALGWYVIADRANEPPALRCRWYKTHPAAVDDHRWSIWVDCNMAFMRSPIDLVRHTQAQGGFGFWTFPHRARTRIRDEAAEIIRLRKHEPQAIRAQLAEYQSQGFDTDANPQTRLSECGVIVRANAPEVRALSDAWWNEIRTRSLRDQMSIDYCAWRRGVEVQHLSGTVWGNQWTQRWQT